MTKADIVQYLSEKIGGLTTAEAAAYVDDVITTIKKTLADGDSVLISGFGKFLIRDKKARMGRNPVTGEKMLLDARRVVTFQPSTLLKELVNKGTEK